MIIIFALIPLREVQQSTADSRGSNIYIYTYIHTYLNTYLHTYIQTYPFKYYTYVDHFQRNPAISTGFAKVSRMYIHTYKHTNEHTYMQTYKQSNKQALNVIVCVLITLREVQRSTADSRGSRGARGTINSNNFFIVFTN